MSTASITTPVQPRAGTARRETAADRLPPVLEPAEVRVAALSAELAAARAEHARMLVDQGRLAARFDNLLTALPGGVVVLDQHGRVQAFNPAAAELLGALTRGDAWAGIVARAFAPRWDDGHDVSLADGRRVNIATQALSGEPGQILLLTDVSETRALQDQLAHHKRLSAKTEMAAAMAHQIRTPLATALLNLGNVKRARDDADRTRVVERALGSLRKLERLVEEMLLFARGGQLAVSAIAIDALVDGIAQQAREAFAIAAFTLDFAPVEGAGSVYANADALISISLNLIDNACHACHGQGRIAIGGRVVDGAFELRFADDGPGIDAAQAGSIFEPFFTTRANGTGLGLAVARGVARAHGGDLVLEAQAVRGACFVLRLPLAGHPAGTDHTAAATAAGRE